MQTSSPSTPRTPQPKQILIIGPPGAGKTTFCLQFPNVAIIDADLNLDGPEQRLRKSNPNLEYRYGAVSIDDKGAIVDEDKRFTRLTTLFDEAKQDPWVKTIVEDSLTNITQILIWQILSLTKGSNMEIKDWGTHRGKMLSMLIKQRLSCKDKTVIFTCHQEDKMKKLDPKSLEATLIGYVPSINPGLQSDLPGMFTDCWHLQMRQKPGNTYQNILTTMPTGMMPFLKNSMGMPAELDVTENVQSILAKYWPK